MRLRLSSILVATLICLSISVAHAARRADYLIREDIIANGPFTLADGYYDIEFNRGFYEKSARNRAVVQEDYGLPVVTYLVNKKSGAILVRLPDNNYSSSGRIEVDSVENVPLVFIRERFDEDNSVLNVLLLEKDGSKVSAELLTAWEEMSESLINTLMKTKKYAAILRKTSEPEIRIVSSAEKEPRKGVFSFVVSASAASGSASLAGSGKLQLVGQGAETRFQVIEFSIKSIKP